MEPFLGQEFQISSLLSVIKEYCENWYEHLGKMKEEHIPKCAVNSGFYYFYLLLS
jgi:hypothetical protein